VSRIHITDVVVSRLKEPGIYYDTTTPAFGIRIGKNRKAWVITKGNDRQRITIGRYPSMTLAEARKEAKKQLAETPLDRKARITLSAAYEDYKATLPTKKPRTQRDYKRVLDKYFEPKLGSKQLGAVGYEDAMDCVEGLPPSEKAHALAVVRTFFRWCVKPPRRYIPHSPIEGVEIKLAKKRKRVLMEGELVQVWRAAEEQSHPYGTIVQLLIMTGQRRGEIAALRWPWINEKERTITLPGEVTKNGLEHTFPYNGQVASVLETVPRLNSTDLLFPSRVSDERPVSGWSKYKKELADGVDGWTLHDLRRTFRTLHGEIGTDRQIAERLINHAAGVTTDVEAIYDRFTYMPQMRAAMKTYDAYISTLLARD
jgi:integrase